MHQASGIGHTARGAIAKHLLAQAVADGCDSVRVLVRSLLQLAALLKPHLHASIRAPSHAMAHVEMR